MTYLILPVICREDNIDAIKQHLSKMENAPRTDFAIAFKHRSNHIMTITEISNGLKDWPPGMTVVRKHDGKQMTVTSHGVGLDNRGRLKLAVFVGPDEVPYLLEEITHLT